MIRSHFISAWLSGGKFYMKSQLYVECEDYDIKSLWLNFDSCAGLHEAADFPLIPFDDSRKECWEYINKACEIVGRPPGRPGWALNTEDAQKVYSAIGEPPFASYSIYMITVSGSGREEETPVYVGQTNSINHRFRGGHAAISKLHAPKYDGKEKRIYFGCVSAVNDDDNTFPVEWINPPESRDKLLSSVEYQLIYDLQPELNTTGKDKYLVPIPTPIVVQNMVGKILDAQSFGPPEISDEE